MKYISTFNESNQDDKITDKDLELIENCFLDYIEQTYDGEFTPQSCKFYDFRHYSSKKMQFVSLDFKIPEPSHASVQQLIDYVRKTNSKIGKRATIGQINDLKKYLLWRWIHGFVSQISGDVKRCESYGFKCYFNLYIPALIEDIRTIDLTIKSKNANIGEVRFPTPESVLSHALKMMNSIEAEYQFTTF